MSVDGKRIAIVGYHLESHSMAPPTVKDDFTAMCWMEGDEITENAHKVSSLPSEISGFYEHMDKLGEWDPVPIIVVAAPPGGPAQRELWQSFMRLVEHRLRAAMPLDAVYIGNHGASYAEGSDDTEGDLAEMIRSIVGSDVPVAATYDLHCNISARNAKALSALIAYRTNPHVDQRQCAAEAADLIAEGLSGAKLVTSLVKLPFIAPPVSLLTKSGPFADAIAYADSLVDSKGSGPIANVSITPGFAYADLPKCGMTVTVTARGDEKAARDCAQAVARYIWNDRERYTPDMRSVAEAVSLARSSDKPLIFADVADNPGGGARGNTLWLLEAFDKANVPGVILGIFVSPELVKKAKSAGEGGEFDAVFECTEAICPREYRKRVRVLKLTDGEAIGRRGSRAGRALKLGDTALLELVDSGVRVVVGSLRRQLTDPVVFEMHGVDIAKAGVVIVKSRGHFRAGFDEFFSDDRIFNIDSKGIIAQDYSLLPFKRLPQPLWPLSKDATWAPSPN